MYQALTFPEFFADTMHRGMRHETEAVGVAFFLVFYMLSVYGICIVTLFVSRTRWAWPSSWCSTCFRCTASATSLSASFSRHSNWRMRRRRTCKHRYEEEDSMSYEEEDTCMLYRACSLYMYRTYMLPCIIHMRRRIACLMKRRIHACCIKMRKRRTCKHRLACLRNIHKKLHTYIYICIYVLYVSYLSAVGLPQKHPQKIHTHTHIYIYIYI